jgi:hypothetical protein
VPVRPAALPRLLLAVLLAAGLLAVLPSAASAATPPGYDVVGSELPAGATLHPGEELLSPGGIYGLLMQWDGNLVMYSCPPGGNSGGSSCPYALWSLGTSGRPGNVLTMQTDGNLVVYDTAGRPVWSTGSFGSGSSNVFRMQDDANMVVYNGSRAVWWTGVPWNYAHVAGRQVADLHSLNGRYYFGTPGNGMGVADLVTHSPYEWHIDCLKDPRVNCQVFGQLVLQTDGNLVWYQPGVNGGMVAEWNSGTWGTGPSTYLVMQDDGNLVLYDLAGRPLWNSRGYPVARVH